MSAPELRRILIVDDEPDILTVTRAVLRNLGGYEIRVCGDSREAVAHAVEFAPDLILLDVMMPAMDGPATLKAFRERAETERTPVAFMTAKVMPEDATRYGGLDVSGVIPKPFSPESLVEQVRAIWRDCALAGEAQPEQDFVDQLRDAMADYGARIPAKLAEISEAFEAVRTGTVETEAAEHFSRLAHRLAGTAETFGFPEVGRAAAALEAGIETHVRVGETLAEEATGDLARCVDALRDAAPETN